MFLSPVVWQLSVSLDLDKTQNLQLILFSGQESQEGREGQETEDHLQPGADRPAGGGVQRDGVHQQAQAVRAGREAAALRDSDQDLVPEQESQGQED